MNPEKIHAIIKARRIDAFLVSNLKNIQYLTGFTGSSAYALITKDRRFFLTDFRYKEQAEREIKDWDIIIQKGKWIKTIYSLIKKSGIKRLGFEVTVSYVFFEILNKSGAALVPLKNLVERLRKFKTEEEIANIKEAVQRAERAFLNIKHLIRIGVRESEIAKRLDEQLKKAGCRKAPFDIIVASGINSSMPHAKFTEKKIESGDLVIIDWGGESNGYFSDMTRTLLIDGSNLSEKKKIYKIVNAAREKALTTAKEGVKTRDIDRSARDVIKKAGYAKFFGHATGHGVGLDVHEAPSISYLNSERISETMVFTVEPGIYLPGLGGVRIEDMVLIQNGIAKTLTSLPRELEIIKQR